MAEVEEKQTETEAVNEEQPQEKKGKKPRKNAKDDKNEGEEKPKKPRQRHMDNPPIHDMIIEALDVLEERKGVTLRAIKRYLEDNYHVDMSKLAAHVRKVLKNGVDNGDIIRTRGVGAMGRFKVKHVKPTMVKKRQAPEDYQQLPYSNKHAKPRKVTATPKKKVVEVPKAKTPTAGKAGRPGRKRN